MIDLKPLKTGGEQGHTPKSGLAALIASQQQTGLFHQPMVPVKHNHRNTCGSSIHEERPLKFIC